MRIIRGRFKTRRYTAPKGFPSRPTTDFAKEGLFNILENQLSFGELKILDLCAGTGNISFEFLSREAGQVTAVDNNFKCIGHIKHMAEHYDCKNEIRIVKSDIIKFLSTCEEQYDLIFADPPYNFDRYEAIAEEVFNRGLLANEGTLIIEHGKETDLQNITHFAFLRKFGNVQFSFFN